MDTHLTPYCGRNVSLLANSPMLLETNSKLNSVCMNIITQGKQQNALWKSLLNQLEDISKMTSSPSFISSRYKFEILSEAIVPYLEKMLVPRFSLDNKRFVQLQMLLTELAPRGNQELLIIHPAVILLKIDQIVLEIKREKSLWPSELACALEIATQKQWKPILDDHRALLSSIGGKSIMVGLIQIIGRPLLFGYPIYVLSLEIMRIATKLGIQGNNNNNMSRLHLQKLEISDCLKMGKLVIMCLAVYQAIFILSMFQNIGSTCLFCGLVCLGATSNEAYLKNIIPAISPYILTIHNLFTKAEQMEQSMMNGFSYITEQQQRDFPISSQVEELIPPLVEAVPLPFEDFPSQSQAGIRQRNIFGRS